MKQYAEAFYKSTQWDKCRRSYLKHVGGLCERCLSKGLIVPAKIVHHKVYLTPESIADPSITLCFDNLEALCQDCHNKEHFKSKKRFFVDEFGHVIIPCEP